MPHRTENNDHDFRNFFYHRKKIFSDRIYVQTKEEKKDFSVLIGTLQWFSFVFFPIVLRNNFNIFLF